MNEGSDRLNARTTGPDPEFEEWRCQVSGCKTKSEDNLWMFLELKDNSESSHGSVGSSAAAPFLLCLLIITLYDEEVGEGSGSPI